MFRSSPSTLRPYRARLPVTDVNGHVTYGGEAVAWFRLHERPWTGLSDKQRAGQISQDAAGLANLVGRRIHYRGTVRAFGADRWAGQWLARNAERATPPNPDVYSTRVAALSHHLRRTNTSVVEWYAGVPFADRGLVAKANTERGKKPSRREQERLHDALVEVTDLMSHPGVDGVPAEHSDLRRLVAASVAPHIPQRDWTVVGDRLGEGDVPSLTDGVTVFPEGRFTQIVGHPERTGLDADVTMWVAVLCIGKAEAQHVPGSHRPLVSLARRLPFSTEWSLHYTVESGQDAATAMKRKVDTAIDNRKQLHDQGEAVDPEIEEVVSIGTRLRHQMKTGDKVTATRVDGVLRVAVAGLTRRECEKRAIALTALYGGQNVEVYWPRHGQAALLREFLPGAKPLSRVHPRRGPVTTFAAMVPTMAARIGDGVGIPIGCTSGDVAEPVFFDPHNAIYNGEVSGFVPITGGQGAGKSALTAWFAAHAALGGCLTTLTDPANNLHRLADVPELRDITTVTDVVGAGVAGSLSPWGVVPDPVRVAVEDTREAYKAAKEIAARTRLALARDVAVMLLPAEFLAAGSHPRHVILQAVRAVGSDRDGSMIRVCEELRKDKTFTTDARAIADHLESLADNDPRVRLMFDPYPVGVLGDVMRRPFLIFTMGGLVLPDVGTDPNRWTDEERISVPLFHSVTHLTTARVFGAPRHIPKLLGLDETHELARSDSGKALGNRLIRDSRKNRTCVLAATQLARDVLSIPGGTLCEQTFVGRTSDESDREDALRLLRQEGNDRIGADLARLSGLRGDTADATRPREFYMRDYQARVERLTVDLRSWPALMEAINPAKVPA